MKKYLSLLLAAVFVMSVGTVAYAAPADSQQEPISDIAVTEVDPADKNSIIDDGSNNTVEYYPELFAEETTSDPVAEDAIIDDGSNNAINARKVTARTNCGANFRKKASTSGELIATIKSGTDVEVVDSNYSASWAKVKYKKVGDTFAKTGYILKSSLDF